MKTMPNSTYPVLALFVLAGFALSPAALAVDPPPDGGYPGDNTAVGEDALFSLTTGLDNTAIGFNALYHNTSGNGNTATGWAVLFNNTTGFTNTAAGVYALISNTANGFRALVRNTTGHDNIALGNLAGENLTTGHHNIDIGNGGVAGESNTIRIGTTGHTASYIAGISGATVPLGVGVIIDATGHLGTVVSSARFKKQIKPMDKASEAILSLQPVSFRYKKELDPDGIPQFGLVAEEVAKVIPSLVARDEQGKPYSVRYEAVNAMLLNEFLKEHRKVETLEAKVAKLEAILEKVSARLETEQSIPRLVESR